MHFWGSGFRGSVGDRAIATILLTQKAFKSVSVSAIEEIQELATLATSKFYITCSKAI